MSGPVPVVVACTAAADDNGMRALRRFDRRNW